MHYDYCLAEMSKYFPLHQKDMFGSKDMVNSSKVDTPLIPL